MDADLVNPEPVALRVVLIHKGEEVGYLNHVYSEELPRRRESLAIYSWSMSEQDEHILAALAKSRPKRVAVSFHGGNPTAQIFQRVKKL